jgi:hypothetical protein
MRARSVLLMIADSESNRANRVGGLVTVKRVIVLVAIAVVAALTVTVFVLRAQEESVTAGMVAQADRLDIPSDWKLLEEVIRPEQTLCLSTNPCPSMSRRWQTGAELSAADLQRIAQPTGVVLNIEGRCAGDGKPSSDSGVCSGRAAHGDYMLSLYGYNEGTDSTLSLTVKPLS